MTSHLNTKYGYFVELTNEKIFNFVRDKIFESDYLDLDASQRLQSVAEQNADKLVKLRLHDESNPFYLKRSDNEDDLPRRVCVWTSPRDPVDPTQMVIIEEVEVPHGDHQLAIPVRMFIGPQASFSGWVKPPSMRGAAFSTAPFSAVVCINQDRSLCSKVVEPILVHLQERMSLFSEGMFQVANADLNNILQLAKQVWAHAGGKNIDIPDGEIDFKTVEKLSFSAAQIFVPPNDLNYFSPENIRLRAPYLRAHNITDRSMSTASYGLGPVYNLISAAGNIVLGATLSHGDSVFSSTEHAFQDADLYVPKPGVGSFDGLTAHRSGERKGQIDFHTSSSSPHPALLTPDDFNAVLALAFIDEITPGFTLDKATEQEGAKPPANMFLCEKKWRPEWLAHTDFGKTLFACDILMAEITTNPAAMIANMQSHSAFDDATKAEIEEFLWEAARLYRQKHPKHFSLKCWRIHPSASVEYVKLFDDLESKPNQYFMISTNATPRIRGWYEENWKKGEELHVNDPKYAAGAYANYLTQNYHMLELCAPTFDRFKQITRLYYAFKKLRDIGFEPDKQLMNQAHAYRQKAASRPPIPVEGRLMNFSSYVKLEG